jgi:Domain of unknown function (DUF4338)
MIRRANRSRQLIRNRAPQFLSGRAFTAQEIQDIQETVEVCTRFALPWTELVFTICEHLNWVTPTGRYKDRSCMDALRRLEVLGLIQLPARPATRRPDAKIVPGCRTDPEEEIVGTVRDIAPLRLEPVCEKQAIQLWNEYVARYHPLGYRRPFGAHQRYFVIGRDARRLGCLLFAAAAWALVERDHWIGWSAQDRAQRLNWVVANTRFILFPWVRLKNLASKVLSLAAQRIRSDWQQRYGYAPVLLETFVELGRYRGTCYRAANWIRVGVTRGEGRLGRHSPYRSVPREIYVYPLVADFRSFLQGRSDESAQPSGATQRRAET